MNSTENPTHQRIWHRSIIKEIEPTNSLESDCISIDHQGSSNLSLHNDSIVQTKAIPTNLSCNNNHHNISLENLYERSVLFSSELTISRCHVRHASQESLCSPTSNSFSQFTEHEDNISIRPFRSHSFDTLLLPRLHETNTGDSGTGDSLVHVSPTTMTKPLHYEKVPIFDQPIVALMANRYDFDPMKIDEYRNRRRNLFKPPIHKSPQSPEPTTPKPSRKTPGESKKPSLMGRLLRPFKSSTPKETFEPMVRHHSSQSTKSEETF